MCLNTGLPCEDIGAEFAETPFGIMGVAQLYNTGKMNIKISPIIKDSAYEVEETLLHEIAHLMTYAKSMREGRRINNGHNHSFMVNCKKVSRAYGKHPKHCSKGAH